jgi:hypothetical protein
VILKARQRRFTTFIQLLMLDARVFNSDVRAGTIAHTLPDAQVIFRDKVRFPRPPAGNDQERGAGVQRQRHRAVAGQQFLDPRRRVAALRHAAIYPQLGMRQDLRKISREGPRGAKRRAQHRGQHGLVFIERPAEGQDGHFFELYQAARTRRNAGDALTAMDFKFHFSPQHDDEAYGLAAGSVDLPASYFDYFARLERLGITLLPDQKAW